MPSAGSTLEIVLGLQVHGLGSAIVVIDAVAVAVAAGWSKPEGASPLRG